MRRFVPLVLVALVACARPASVADRAHGIEAQVWSPYCPGRLLIDCTTTQARELRAEIQERVGDGDSAEDVLAWIRDEFGDEAVARPDASGAGLVIWLVPALIFAGGAMVVARVIRRGRTRDHVV